MKPKILKKPEKIVGYVLLIIGLIVVILPTYFGVSIILTGASAIPKILETPVLSDATTPTNNATVLLPISTVDINEMIEKTFPATNLGLFLALCHSHIRRQRNNGQRRESHKRNKAEGCERGCQRNR